MHTNNLDFSPGFKKFKLLNPVGFLQNISIFDLLSLNKKGESHNALIHGPKNSNQNFAKLLVTLGQFSQNHVHIIFLFSLLVIH